MGYGGYHRLAASPASDILYTASDSNSGCLSAQKINTVTPGALTTQLGSLANWFSNTGPRQIAISGNNKWAIACGYTSNQIGIGAINTDGSLPAAATLMSGLSAPITVVITGYLSLPLAMTLVPATSIGQVQPGTASVPDQGTSATYKWSIVNGTLTSATTGSAVTFTAGDYGTVSLVCAVSISGVATSQASGALAITGTIPPPAITLQPSSQQACLGGNVNLMVGANLASGYQWYKNGTAISSAANASALTSTLTLTGVAAGDAGSYFCRVSNSIAYTVDSAAATLLVGSNAAIATQPQGAIAYVGQTATFSVSVAGTGSFTYQWFKNSAAIPAATASVYTTPPLAESDNDSVFSVSVTDPCSTVLLSSSASLLVYRADVPPTISIQPLPQTVAIGSTTSFTVVASGSGTLTYQWYRLARGSTVRKAIAGAIGATYAVPSSLTQASNDGDQYYVVITNAYGLAASNLTSLAVGQGILIQLTAQPQSVFVSLGSAASFGVTATSLAPLTYQWQRAEPGTSLFVPISGATQAAYTLNSTASSDSGAVYQCVVSNGATQPVTSANAALFVGSLGTLPVGGFSDAGWIMKGNTSSVASPAGFKLTSSVASQAGRLFWPNLLSTAKLTISFTLNISSPSNPPADGCCLILVDPTLGGSVNSVGLNGAGLGAEGIPGFLLGFDTYQNTGDATVPYLGVGRSDTGLFENPWSNVNTNLGPLATGVAHAYVVSFLNGTMTVTMDGNQVFTGPVSVPPVAYLGFTASTGLYYETHQLSNFSATLAGP